MMVVEITFAMFTSLIASSVSTEKMPLAGVVFHKIRLDSDEDNPEIVLVEGTGGTYGLIQVVKKL